MPTTASAVYDPQSKPLLTNGEKISYFSVDAIGNAEAPKTSRPVRIAEPDTIIDRAPATLGKDARPAVAFSSPIAAAIFECSFDGAPFTACASPITPAQPLTDGEHRFAVRAVVAGASDPTPAQATFVIDTAAPAAPEITAGPEGPTTERSPAFVFTGEPGAFFACSVDGGRVTPCTSPVTLSELTPGAHSFAVLQFDGAGNASAVAARSFTVTVKAAQLCFGRPATIVSAGRVRIDGTPGDDVIIGGPAGERIDGRGGNDRVCAGGGPDRVKGGAGNDRIEGGRGKDRLSGGAGRDLLRSIRKAVDADDCGPGRDKVRADGKDRVVGCEERLRGARS